MCVCRFTLGPAHFEQARHAPYEVTGLGSLNQIHCTLPPATKQLGGDLLFFELLQSGFWLAQRGLLCTSLETTEAQAEQLVRAVDRILVKHRDTFP
jgi:glutamate-1-semialdehyde 2,1-aminomutase